MVPLHRAALPAALLVLGIAAAGHPPAPAHASPRATPAFVVTAEAPLVARVSETADRQRQFDTGIPTTVPPTTVPAIVASAADVVALTNAERAGRGLGAVRVDSRLTQAAQAHSIDQAAMNRMSHTGSDGSDAGERITRTGYPFVTWGENVAAGYPDAASVMAGWMGSSGHRANILNARFVDIGVAVALSADGTPYWTMVLAA